MKTDHPHTRRLIPALLVMVLLGACASSPQGRSKMTTPGPISDVYSDADLKLYLATLPNIESPCSGEQCEENQAFDAQVQHLGGHLADAAYDAHPDLKHRIPKFNFSVAEKDRPGISSNASGDIVILRGVQQLGLNDETLAFVLARELGHVISQHHEENTSTRIMLSVAATLLFPALNLFGNTATVAQATTATTTSTAVMTTAASTATSYVGSKLLLNNVHPDQMSEADMVALDLLDRMGYPRRRIVQALQDSPDFEGSGPWGEDFRLSVQHLQALEMTNPLEDGMPEEEAPADELPPLMEAVDDHSAEVDPPPTVMTSSDTTAIATTPSPIEAQTTPPSPEPATPPEITGGASRSNAPVHPQKTAQKSPSLEKSKPSTSRSNAAGAMHTERHPDKKDVKAKGHDKVLAGKTGKHDHAIREAKNTAKRTVQNPKSPATSQGKKNKEKSGTARKPKSRG